MSATPNQFFWYELMTTEPAAAEAFYRAVVGWTAVKPGGPHDYTVLETGGIGVAGLMQIPDEAVARGAKPAWVGYIHVEDVDAHVKRVVAAGGAEYRPAEDIPDVGRFAVVADPQGAVFLMMTPEPSMSRPPVPPAAIGTVGWHELLAADGPSALEFYVKTFGWTKTGAHPMGPMGDYLLFGTGEEPFGFGGMMTKPPQVPAPFWTYYFYVDSVTAAVERIKAAGGTVVNGPMEVPSGDWIVQGLDPQGVWFALLSAGR